MDLFWNNFRSCIRLHIEHVRRKSISHCYGVYYSYGTNNIVTEK